MVVVLPVHLHHSLIALVWLAIAFPTYCGCGTIDECAIWSLSVSCYPSLRQIYLPSPGSVLLLPAHHLLLPNQIRPSILSSLFPRNLWTPFCCPGSSASGSLCTCSLETPPVLLLPTSVTYLLISGWYLGVFQTQGYSGLYICLQTPPPLCCTVSHTCIPIFIWQFLLLCNIILLW